MTDENTQLIRCPNCGAPKTNYVGPWNTETKCDYCGATFFIHQKENVEQDDEDFAVKTAAFEDSIAHTGGEELYPGRNEAESKADDYLRGRAITGMIVGALFSVFFMALAINSFLNQNVGGSVVFVLLTAMFLIVSFVCYRFLPGDEGTHKVPDYGGD